MMKMINTLLVSRHTILCEGVRRIFDGTSFAVSADVRKPSDAVISLQEGIRTDLVLSEVYDEFTDFVQFVRRLECSPKVVVLAPPQESLPADFPYQEINGLLNQYVSPTALIRSLELAMSDEEIYPINSAFLAALQTTQNPIAQLSKELEDLSWREIEILRCLVLGYPNKTIARQLKIAETTVKAHVKTILRKTKAGNRTQAAMWSMSRGISGLDMPFPGSIGVNSGSREQKRGPVLLPNIVNRKRANGVEELRSGGRNQPPSLHVVLPGGLG